MHNLCNTLTKFRLIVPFQVVLYKGRESGSYKKCLHFLGASLITVSVAL